MKPLVRLDQGLFLLDVASPGFLLKLFGFSVVDGYFLQSGHLRMNG